MLFSMKSYQLCLCLHDWTWGMMPHGGRTEQNTRQGRKFNCQSSVLEPWLKKNSKNKNKSNNKNVQCQTSSKDIKKSVSFAQSKSDFHSISPLPACRWRQTRLQESWVLHSHGSRTRCRTRSVRWLARWPRPRPCRPPPPPPPPPCPPPLSPHPPPPNSAPMRWSYSPSLRSRTGNWYSSHNFATLPFTFSRR